MNEKPTHIILVDDDADFQVLVGRAVRQLGVKASLTCLSGGQEAIRYFSEEGAGPTADLVLLDLKMPRVSGFEVLEHLKAMPSADHLPVVILTSSDHEADRERALSLGARAYEIKPVHFSGLTTLLRNLVERLLVR